jgi:heme-degrading monooxygenase HmoA
MYCGMALSTARPGRKEELTLAALDHAAALRQQPGIVAAYVLSERGSAAQVSLSIFESEEAFQRGVESTMPVIAKHHIEELCDGPPTYRVFDVR